MAGASARAMRVVQPEVHAIGAVGREAVVLLLPVRDSCSTESDEDGDGVGGMKKAFVNMGFYHDGVGQLIAPDGKGLAPMSFRWGRAWWVGPGVWYVSLRWKLNENAKPLEFLHTKWFEVFVQFSPYYRLFRVWVSKL